MHYKIFDIFDFLDDIASDFCLSKSIRKNIDSEIFKVAYDKLSDDFSNELIDKVQKSVWEKLDGQVWFAVFEKLYYIKSS